ncbi:MAG: TetR/AcrR family transcriptional regulator [Saprospiraceae bacterium]|nr:TetR/AcrR family transcriptional regulator [Saprospiraceae bacterium]
MNKTKQKILTHSLELFNTLGISNVALRDISKKAGISVGNLQYHFKKREEIVEALYFQLVEKIDKIIIEKNKDLLTAFSSISVAIIHYFFEYRFFFLDFVTITRNNPKIKAHYAQLSKRRKQEFSQMIHILIEHNILREELIENEYLNWYKRMEVISNFWFSSVLIQNDSLEKASIDEYLILVNQSLFPYLTNAARETYKELFEQSK